MKPIRLASCVVLFTLVLAGPAFAAGDLTQQKTVDVTVQLGDKDNAFRFYPSKLEFETGKLYRMILRNVSPEKHYFSSDGLSQAVFTRKVQVLGKDGNTVAEIKGTIREIEVYPGGVAEWWFVPVKAGVITDLKCTIKGHAEGGMTGTIEIK